MREGMEIRAMELRMVPGGICVICCTNTYQVEAQLASEDSSKD